MEHTEEVENGVTSVTDDWKTVPSVQSLEELTRHLRQTFESSCVNVDYVKALLAAYKSNQNDWKKYAKFDTHRYTRNLVDTGNGRYNLMILCWGEGQGSSIHDHSNSHCFVKILDGELTETMFAWPDDNNKQTETDGTVSTPELEKTADSRWEGTEISEEEQRTMKETGVNVYCRDGVTYINDTIGLHRIENASHVNPAVSLHLYCPPFNTCRTFDQRTSVARTVQMTFWSEYGVRTPFHEKLNECSRVSSHVAASSINNTADLK